jgi:hypothetical protein
MNKFFLLLTVLSFSFLTAFSQTKVPKLLNAKTAQEIKMKIQKEKAEADSIAAKEKMPIRKQLSDGRVIELQRFENGMPIYYSTENLNAAKTVSTNKVWDGGLAGYSLSGKGQTLGVWDGGAVLATHQELAGRVTQMDGVSTTLDHSTHVSGTMIATGVSAPAHGMANGASINAYDWNYDWSEVSSAADAGLKVSNHSYGSLEGWSYNYFDDNLWAWFGDVSISATEDYKFGLYTSSSQNWDLLAYQHPYYLLCKSAGNDRGEAGPAAGVAYWVRINGGWTKSTVARENDGGADGFDCLDYLGVCKNVLTVGAVGPLTGGYTKASDVSMSSFSSWGPTDDGRIKPDIVADGVSLTSCTNTSNTAYEVMSGTSMATPNVTGSLGLLLEHQNNLHPDTAIYAATLKAIVINTADEAGANPGPDYAFGWGLLNTWKAAQLMSLNSQLSGDQLIKQLTINQGVPLSYQVTSNGNEPLKVTICWADYPSSPAPTSLNPKDLMLVDDLDLRIVGPGGTYYPWVLDPSNPSKAATTGDNIRDNVEQVYIQSPAAGTYTIKVSHKGTLLTGAQDFSMVLSGIALPTPEAPELVFPTNKAADQDYNLKFNWKLSAKATSYEIQVSTDSLFSSVIVDTTIVGVYDQVNGLPALKNVYWRVRGVNNGGTSSWSPVWNFIPKMYLASVPVLVLPQNNVINLSPVSPVLKWNAAANATTYRLRLSQNAIFTSLVVNDSTVTDTSYSIKQTLQENKKYYWNLNAKNTTGTSAYSGSWNFTTSLYAPDSLQVSNVSAKKVKLSWLDKSSAESKYYVTRKNNSASVYSVIDSLAANVTSYIDSTVAGNATYSYKVYCASSSAASDSSNAASITTITAVNDHSSTMPQNYTLYQNYPNPFNPKTSIQYAIPFESSVKIVVYNILGEVVRELVNNVQSPGYHAIDFDGSSISSGVYLYSIIAKSADGTKEFRDVKKLMLMK